MKVAISGKGGVGKTTIAAGIIKHLAARGYQVYAVDADPDTSLGMVLGIPEDRLGNLKPLADMREMLAERAGGDGAFFSLNPDVDDLVRDTTVRYRNILYLKMGTVKAAGSDCYCRENSVLRAMIDALLLNRREAVIMDMGAGIEHLTRGTARGVDAMLIVSEPTLVSIQTARTIQRLAMELGIGVVKFVGNKVRRPTDERFLMDRLPSEDVIGLVPFEERILEQAAGLGGEEEGEVPAGVAEIAERLLRLSVRTGSGAHSS